MRLEWKFIYMQRFIFFNFVYFEIQTLHRQIRFILFKKKKYYLIANIMYLWDADIYSPLFQTIGGHRII